MDKLLLWLAVFGVASAARPATPMFSPFTPMMGFPLYNPQPNPFLGQGMAGRPVAPVGNPEYFNAITENVEHVGRTVHDMFSPPYSWMMQLGMDAYGYRNPNVFKYWQVPDNIATAAGFVMEPTEEEKQRRKEEGEDESVVKGAFNAAGAYATGGDPVNAFISTFQKGNPLRTVASLASGREALTASTLMSLATGSAPDSEESATQKMTNQLTSLVPKGMLNEVNSMLGQVGLGGTRKGSDAVSMMIGTALPQMEASATGDDKKEKTPAATTEAKAEDKTVAATTEAKAEDKTVAVEAKAEDKTPAATTEAKAEDKTVTATTEAKVEDKTVAATEAKAEEKTVAATTETKVEDKTVAATAAKAEDKTVAVEAKAEDKTVAATTEPKALL